MDPRAGLDYLGRGRLIHQTDAVREWTGCVDDDLCPYVPLFACESVSYMSTLNHFFVAICYLGVVRVGKGGQGG